MVNYFAVNEASWDRYPYEPPGRPLRDFIGLTQGSVEKIILSGGPMVGQEAVNFEIVSSTLTPTARRLLKIHRTVCGSVESD